MDDHMAGKPVFLRCYSEGRGDRWEAVCLDFDIAVQGNSFLEVYAALDIAIAEYVRYVMTLPENEREQFLSRKAPLSLRLKFLWYAFWYGLIGAGSRRPKQRHEFFVPNPV